MNDQDQPFEPDTIALATTRLIEDACDPVSQAGILAVLAGRQVEDPGELALDADGNAIVRHAALFALHHSHPLTVTQQLAMAEAVLRAAQAA